MKVKAVVVDLLDHERALPEDGHHAHTSKVPYEDRKRDEINGLVVGNKNLPATREIQREMNG